MGNCGWLSANLIYVGKLYGLYGQICKKCYYEVGFKGFFGPARTVLVRGSMLLVVVDEVQWLPW